MARKKTQAPFDLRGSGGGGGKGGGRSPVEADDTLQSNHVLRAVELLCEGPIEEIEQVYLNETALTDESGNPNFTGVTVFERLGTPDQPHIPGLSDQASETTVDIKVLAATPVVRTINTSDTDSVQLTVRMPGLYQYLDNGDLLGVNLTYRVQYKPSGGSWIDIDDSPFELVEEKATSNVFLTHRFDLTGSAPWDIRVVRDTPDSDNSKLQNDLFFQSFAEIIEQKFNYRNSAVLGIKVSAQEFGDRLPSRAALIKGLICEIPSNFDPVTRTYTGIWDGTFTSAWTDCPAWCLRDIMIKSRYGLGDFITASLLDDTTLYQISKYCAGLVDDGEGGEEHRFTFNAYISTRQQAYDMINAFVSVFRGMAYWSFGLAMFTHDAPGDPVLNVVRANTVSGEFNYEGAALTSVHNRVNITWNDPDDFYKSSIVTVDEPDHIQRYGLRSTDIVAFGCTSKTQAIRAGRWLLYTERMESEVLSYLGGQDHESIKPGDIIRVSDPSTMGVEYGGRLAAYTSTTATLDREVTLESGETYELHIHDKDRTLHYRTITTAPGAVTTVTLDAALPPLTDNPAETVFTIRRSVGADTPLYRVLNVEELAPHQYQVTAAIHSPDKFEIIEGGYDIPSSQPPIFADGPIPEPVRLRAVESVTQRQGTEPQSDAVVSVERPTDARVRGVELQYRERDQTWATVDLRLDLTYTVPNLKVGKRYSFRARCYDGLGDVSGWSYIFNLTPTGDPVDSLTVPVPTDLSVVAGVQSATVKWFSPVVSDFRSVEVWTNSVNNQGTSTKYGEVSGETAVVGGLETGDVVYVWLRTRTHGGRFSDFVYAGTATAKEVSSVDLATAITTSISNAQTEAEDAAASAEAASLLASGAQDDVDAILSNLNAYVDGTYTVIDDILNEDNEAARRAIHNATGLLNPGFEAAGAANVTGVPGGWLAKAHDAADLLTLKTTDTVPADSTRGSEYAFGTDTTTCNWWAVGQRLVAFPAQTFQISARVNTITVGGTWVDSDDWIGEDDVLAEFNWYDEEGTLISTYVEPSAETQYRRANAGAAPASGSWLTYTTGTVTAPAGAAYLEFYLVAVDNSGAVLGTGRETYADHLYGVGQQAAVWLDDVVVTSANGSVLPTTQDTAVAGAFAAAAESSSLSADSFADDASGFASAASGSASAASTSAGNASTSEGNALTQATLSTEASQRAVQTTAGIRNPGFEFGADGDLGAPPGWFLDAKVPASAEAELAIDATEVADAQGSLQSFGTHGLLAGPWWAVWQRLQVTGSQVIGCSVDVNLLNFSGLPSSDDWIAEDDLLFEVISYDVDGVELSPRSISRGALREYYVANGNSVPVGGQGTWFHVDFPSITCHADAAFADVRLVAVDNSNAVIASGTLLDYDTWSSGNSAVLIDNVEFTSVGAIVSIPSGVMETSVNAASALSDAGTAVQAKDDAETAEASAQSWASLSARVSGTGTGVLEDPNFESYLDLTQWQSSGGTPTLTANSVFGVGQDLTFAITTAAQAGALNEDWVGPEDAEFYYIEITLTLNSGAFTGAGVLVDWVNTLGTNFRLTMPFDQAQAGLDWGHVHGVEGRVQTFTAVVEKPSGFTGTFDFNRVNVLAQSTTAFGGTANKNITFHRCFIRPATAEEVGGGLVAVATEASVESLALTIADTNGAVADLRNEIISDVENPAGTSLGATLDQNYTTSANMEVAIANAGLKLQAIAGHEARNYGRANGSLSPQVVTDAYVALAVTAFEDDTKVFVNGSQVATLNALEGYAFAPGAGDVISANGPITTHAGTQALSAGVGQRKAVPLSNLSTRFMGQVTRNPTFSTLFLWSPRDCTVRVSIKAPGVAPDFATPDATVTLTAGVASTYLMSADNGGVAHDYFLYGTAEFIAVEQSSADWTILMPPAKRVINGEGTAPDVTTWSGTGTTTTTLNNLLTTVDDAADVLSASHTGDGDGSDKNTALPVEAMGDTYVIPIDSMDLYRVISLEDNRVEIRNAAGASKAVLSLSGTEDSPAVSSASVAWTDGPFYVTGSAPFALFLNDDTEDEAMLFGYLSSQRASLDQRNTALSATVEAISSASIDDLTGTAFAQVLTDLEADAGGNLATVSRYEQATSDIDGYLAAVSGMAATVVTENGTEVVSEIKVTSGTDPDGGLASVIQLKADQIAIGGGSNHLTNTDFRGGVGPGTEWIEGDKLDPAGSQHTLLYRAPGLGWAGKTFPTLQVTQSTAETSGWYEVWCMPYEDEAGTTGYGFAVKPGSTYEASAYVSAHRCQVNVRIQWFDLAGAKLSADDLGNNLNVASSGGNPDEWPRVGGIATAPAGAFFATIALRKSATNSGASSFMFVHKPMLAETHANASALTQWSTGGITMISGDRLVTGAVTADKITVANLAAIGVTVGTADIDTAAITSAKIGDLEVETIKVADGAITETVTANVGGTTTNNSATPTTVFSVDFDSTDYAAMIGAYRFDMTYSSASALPGTAVIKVWIGDPAGTKFLVEQWTQGYLNFYSPGRRILGTLSDSTNLPSAPTLWATIENFGGEGVELVEMWASVIKK